MHSLGVSVVGLQGVGWGWRAATRGTWAYKRGVAATGVEGRYRGGFEGYRGGLGAEGEAGIARGGCGTSWGAVVKAAIQQKCTKFECS